MYHLEQMNKVFNNYNDNQLSKTNWSGIICLIILTIIMSILLAVAITTTIIYTVQNVNVDNCTYSIENNLLYPNTVNCYLNYMSNMTRVNCYNNPTYDKTDITVPCYTFIKHNQYYAEKSKEDAQCLQMIKKYGFGCWLPIISWILGIILLIICVVGIIILIKNRETNIETI